VKLVIICTKYQKKYQKTRLFFKQKYLLL